MKRWKKRIEVRRDPPSKRCPDGDIDEVCGRGEWHLERMNDSQISLMLYGDAGDVMCLFFEPAVWPKRGSAKHVRARIFWHERGARPGKTLGGPKGGA